MGDVPLSDLPAAAIYTRLGVMAKRLGIDPFQFESSRNQLTSAVNRYARISLDADFRRIALRTFVPQPPMLVRPGTTYLEVESNPHSDVPNGSLLVVGARALDEDLRVLARGTPGVDLTDLEARLQVFGAGTPPVAPSVVAELADKLRSIGATQADVLGQRYRSGEVHWLVGVELPATSVREASVIADAIGVEPYHRVMLGALHDELSAKGCLLTLSCTPAAMHAEVTIEYRDLSWEQVVTTSARLRNVKTGEGFGVLAGAFAAERAAFYEITLRRGQVPGARAAIEHHGG